VHVQIGKKIMEANLELDAPKHVFIMLYMLLDRRRLDSFFKPYYDILPQTLSNMPILCSEE
jgi:histone-lysine N-methyltransferase SETD3